MKQIAIGIDAITITFTNTTASIENAKKLLLSDQLFNSNIQDFEDKSKYEDKRELFLRECGLYFKITYNEIEIQFKSTFFAIATYDTFICLKKRLRHFFKTPILVKEFHIAQDFLNLPVGKFFPKDLSSLKFQFKCYTDDPRYEMKSRYPGTRYINGPRKKWQIAVYDKTKELRDNATRDTIEKQEYYKSKGYFENEVTRVELKFFTEYCRDFFKVFEEEEKEIDLCHLLLNEWYRKHKVRSLKRGQVWNPKHPERVNEWHKWKKLFKKSNRIPKRTEFPKDVTWKKPFEVDEEKVVRKISQYSMKYAIDPEKLHYLLLFQSKDIVKQARDRNVRLRKTQDYLKHLQPDKYPEAS